MELKVTLIRSGATKAGLAEKYLGILDEPLCQEGRDQLLQKISGDIYPLADLVFSSSMTRALETARMIYPNIPAVVLPELNALDYGIFAGRGMDELETDERFLCWMSSKGVRTLPQGEEPYAFVQRCNRAFLGIVREAAGKGLQQVSIISHLSVIRMILQSYHLPQPLYQEWQINWGEGFQAQYDAKTGHLFKIKAIKG